MAEHILRSGQLAAPKMINSLTLFGHDLEDPETPVITHASAPELFLDGVAAALKREVAQACVWGRVGYSYMGWLTDDEWIWLKMKCF